MGGETSGQPITAAQGMGFLYAASNDVSAGGSLLTELVSVHTATPHQLSQATALSFWYHARGFGVRRLDVELVSVDSTGHFGAERLLWEHVGGTQSGWQLATVPLCSDSPFLVRLYVVWIIWSVR